MNEEILTPKKVLVCDDNKGLVQLIISSLEHEGYEIIPVYKGADAINAVKEGFIGVVLMDVKLPDMDGITAFELIRDEAPDIPVVMITAHGSIGLAVDLVQKGAFDFIPKGSGFIDKLKVSLHNAFKFSALDRRVKILESQVTTQYDFSQIIAQSAAMRKILADVSRVVESNVPVLITGETGTGKELIARAIHFNSPRKSHVFLPVNCAGIPEGLLESEMFGYEKGAFTGAEKTRKGKFELAHTGTIFLDEVGELPMQLQAKLLRVLQEGRFSRVGGDREIEVNVRVISATNRDLIEEVKQGRFRDDLYYRLAVFPIHIPPLRERREDIYPLAEFFLKEFVKKERKENIKGFDRKALQFLMEYPFPGNVRELRNMVRHAVLVAKGKLITATDFDTSSTNRAELIISRVSDAVGRALDLDSFMQAAVPERSYVLPLKEIEDAYIKRVLQLFDNNISRAAKALGVTRRTIYNRLKDNRD